MLYYICCTVYVVLYMLYCICCTVYAVLYMLYCICCTVYAVWYMFVGGIVETTVRDYFNLDNAAWLTKYNGPVRLIRRTQDEMISV